MSNPFDQFSSDLQGALPPAGNDSYTPYPPQGGVMNSPPAQTYPAYQQQPQPGAYGAPPPSYGAPPPAYGAPPPDYGSPPPSYGAPAPAYGAPQQEYGAPPPSFGSPQPDYAPPQDGNPFGAPPQMAPPPPPVDSNPFAAPQQALVPSGQPQQSPYAMPSGAPLGMGSPQQNGYAPPTDVGNPYGAPDAGNPFGAPAPMPPGPPPSADPWASPGPPQYHQPQSDPMYGAIVPAGPPVDPFSVFNSAPAPPPAAPPMDVYGGGYAPPPQGPPQGGAPVGSGDVFADMGFGPPVPSSAPLPTNSDGIFETAIVATEPGQRKQEGDLPPGGEWYDARIFTPTLGVMFFKPQELTDSLFLNTDRETVDALAERPVVAFIVEGSSARSAGVELGHVLLKVNGVDVKNPKDASRLIKEGPRPLPLLFYVPPADVVVAEGEHMVKYDTRDTTAPNSAKDWKPKYVVIGGIIAQPWMMNMYRSKSEYDIAVIETQARRPVSVKVKQFSLQGARIQNDWQGPQMVKYKNKLHPWKYIVILPIARNPIKISSPNLAQLKPVHEGIRRVLLSQQRDRGNPNTAGPVRESDPYANRGNGGPSSQSRQQDQYNRGPPPQQESRGPPPAPAPAPVPDLLGFDDSPAPAPQPNYGAPPPPQYGAPPPQYGAPPQQQYGAPPPPQYGAPPPPQYGAPPPPQYGAPPPQYGAPPPPQYVQQPYINY